MPGHDLVKTELKPPYDQLYIRRKGAKRRKTGLPVLTAGLARDAAIPETLTVQWDVVEALTQRVDTPEKLLTTWENEFFFRLEGPNDEPGLRLPQIGARGLFSTWLSVEWQFCRFSHPEPDSQLTALVLPDATRFHFGRQTADFEIPKDDVRLHNDS